MPIGWGHLAPTRASTEDTPSDNDLYIGRGDEQHEPSIWGNPFKVSAQISRVSVLRKFGEYLLESDQLIRQLPTLAGKRLRCHCREHQRCHAEVMIDAFRYFFLEPLGHECPLTPCIHTALTYAFQRLESPPSFLAKGDRVTPKGTKPESGREVRGSIADFARLGGGTCGM